MNRKFRENCEGGFKGLRLQPRMVTELCDVHNCEAELSCTPPYYDRDMYKVGTLAQGVCVVVTTLISPLVFSHKTQKAMCITGVPNVCVRGKPGYLRDRFMDFWETWDPS